MKKYLLSLVAVLGIGISAKGMDPLYVAYHGSSFLNDQNWHTLSYFYSHGCSASLDIEIRQMSSGIDYEFVDVNKNSVLDFKNWLLDYQSIWGAKNESVSIKIIHKDGKYMGSFRSSGMVPKLDNVGTFIGIDVLK